MKPHDIYYIAKLACRSIEPEKTMNTLSYLYLDNEIGTALWMYGVSEHTTVRGFIRAFPMGDPLVAEDLLSQLRGLVRPQPFLFNEFFDTWMAVRRIEGTSVPQGLAWVSK